MSGLSEAELHVQAMRLVCEALQDREQDGLEVDWDVLRQMHDQMDAILQALQHKHRYDSSEIVDLRKDRDHWKQARQDAHEAGELMKAEIETLRQQLADAQRAVSDAFAEVNSVRQQLDAANDAETLRQTRIERLNKFVWKVRWADCYIKTLDALAELDADTEPTPVAERCPECDGSGMVDSGGFEPDGKGINVPCGGDCRGNPCPSQLTPVAEPLDAEGGA